MKDSFAEFVVAYVPHTHMYIWKSKWERAFRWKSLGPKLGTHTLTLPPVAEIGKRITAKDSQTQPKMATFVFSKSLLFLRKNPMNFSDVLIEFRLNASLQIISKT